MTQHPHIVMNDCVFEENGTVVRGDNGTIIKASNTLFLRNKKVFDLTGAVQPPQELVERALRELHEMQSRIDGPVDKTMAETAAEKSGLKAWLVDKSVDIASLSTALLTLFLDK